jgi:hypothetical protein
MLDINKFKITAPKYLTQHSPTGNGDVLNILIHKNIGLSHVTVSDILDSDQLPILFHSLVGTKQLSEPQNLQIGNSFKI